jgi:membrane-bound serine protease (ClpP class)
VPSLRAFSVHLGALAGALALSGGAGAADPPRVLAVEFANDVNPVTQDYLNGAIDRAGEDGYDAVVLLVDTPGGLDSSMRAIIKKMLASEVPVVVYVSPEGARAASAGAFLAMAADVAAMAPQTNMGSSSAVSSGGEEIPRTLRKKIEEDAVAYIRGLASEHGRNADWAEDAVRDAANIPAREALEENVVEFVEPTLPELLEAMDGFRTTPKGFVLETAGAEVDRVEMSLWKRILDTLIDPNIIALLLSVGVLGIIVELWNPGLIFPGAVGGISLIVSLFGLQVLPISWAGVLLLVLAFGFFGAEAFVPSHGALTLAGAVCFVLGALLLFDPAGPAFQVSIWVALAIAGTLALVMGFVATKIVQVRRTPAQTGQQELLGQVGVVRQPLDPLGSVFVHGELWRARTAGEPVPAGDLVRVEAVDDALVLDVTRVEKPQRAVPRAGAPA